MALEWLGDLARKINSVVTTPSSEATQLAGEYSEDNPWRTRIGLMTGTPPVDVLQQASNWETNNRNTRLAENRFAAQTVNVTPDMLAKTGLYSPDNLNAPYVMTPGQRRYISDVTGVNNTEYGLRQRDKTRTAQASVLNGLQPYVDELKATPQGLLTLNALQNPDAFPTEEWGKTYGQIPGIIQGGINRTTQAGSTRQMVEAMPDGSTKTLLKQLLPLLDLPGMEGVNDFIYKSALGSVPKPLTENDKLRNRLTQAQIDNIYADNQRADAKEKDAQAKKKKEIQIKASDIANRIAASAASYRTYEDYMADLERHRGELILRIGNAAYNKLVADAPNIPENVFGSRFVPQHKRKVKSGYITFLLNELKKTQ